MSIRVLSIISRMNVGGPAKILEGLLGYLPDRFRVRLLTGTVSQEEADFLEVYSANIPEVVVIPSLGRSPSLVNDARAFASVASEIRNFRPHIVHTHTAKAGVIGRVTATFFGVPIIVHTYHGHLLRGYFGPMGTQTVRGVEKFLGRRTDALVAVGQEVRSDLLAAGIGSPWQYACIPPGVPIPEQIPKTTARDELDLPECSLVVTFVGRLSSIKRPDRLVTVVRNICSERGDVVFLIAGEGPLLAETRVALDGFGDRVRFLGWRDDLERVYAASDVVLLTSDNEGMPVALIEAAMCGVPAVATDVGSVGEVVLDGRTGFLVGPSGSELSRALCWLLDRGDRHRYGESARAWATQEFSTERMVGRTVELYDRLFGSGGR